MLIDNKIAGNIVYIGSYTTVDFINFAAIFAMKMMMVVLASNFVASALAGNVYSFENAIFCEEFYAAVNSCYT